jgi:hypothetical protein
MAGIENAGNMARGPEAIDDVRADEARAARDQDSHLNSI